MNEYLVYNHEVLHILIFTLPMKDSSIFPVCLNVYFMNLLELVFISVYMVQCEIICNMV